MYKIGLSSCGFYLTEENFQKLNNSGIDVIELSMSLNEYENTNPKAVLNLSKRYNVALWSYHLPFMPFNVIDISSLHRELRDNAMKLYVEMIDKYADIGVNKFVIHPSGEPIAKEDREERMKRSMEMLDSVAEYASHHGAVICVEDLPRTCLGNTSDEMIKLISANDKLRVCFDTNHLLSEDNVQFAEKLADKIVTVHVSDYDFVDEKHWMPGEGLVDWVQFFSSLKTHNYSGVWMYEIGLKAPETLLRSRDLTFDDFIKNANEIFDLKKPSRIE